MNKTPSLFVSILPILTIAIFLTVGYGILGIRAEILLVGAAVVAGTIASFLGIPYRDILDGIVKSISKALPAMLIVITVGALIGSWIAAGTIPMLIYFGLDVISPRFFLVTACIVASIVSVVTGTSYGTVGTIGVAFMGIAHGLGISVGQAAGAIVAGAYFGDKISPFSDTTNLAPIAAGSNLYDHIRHMFWTTLPAWVIGLIVYFVTGLASRGGDVSIPETVQIQTVLQETFRFHVILLVPPAITLTAALLKKPVIPGMLLSVLSAVILAISIQGSEIKSAMNSTVTGYTADTSYEMVDTLLTRGGMLSMMDVTLIALCAFAFGGIVQRAGMLDIILERLLRFARTTGRLVASTVLSCIAVAMLTGSSFLSILIPGELFAPAYRRRNLAAKNLSRTTEDSGTVVVPLIPWSIAAVFMSGTLGVDTITFAPWAVFCYTGFLFALFYGFTGIGIAKRIREDESKPGS